MNASDTLGSPGPSQWDSLPFRAEDLMLKANPRPTPSRVRSSLSKLSRENEVPYSSKSKLKTSWLIRSSAILKLLISARTTSITATESTGPGFLLAEISTGGQEDRRTGGQEERRAGGQDDGRTKLLQGQKDQARDHPQNRSSPESLPRGWNQVESWTCGSGTTWIPSRGPPVLMETCTTNPEWDLLQHVLEPPGASECNKTESPPIGSSPE